MDHSSKASHVFLIEDDRDIRTSIIEVMEDEGISVDWAADGKLKEKTQSLQIAGILQKPVDIEQLVNTVRMNLH